MVLTSNKDWLRDIFADRKKLLPLAEVKLVNVPAYDELSVKQLWPQLSGEIGFMAYMPDKLPKGRLPDRTYFFNVLK